MDSSQKTTILCIDDEEEICFSLKTLFQTQNWETAIAYNVADGLRLFSRVRPSLVLIDYHMPDINGVEGVRMLRKLSDNVPILVFTIDESQDVADSFLSAGASDFALKPIKAPDIVSRIKLHLRLLGQQNSQWSDTAKGISISTLDLVLDYLNNCQMPATVNEISCGTGLAYQTVCRYVQHMVQQHLIVTESVYGKVGRPKNVYRPADVTKPQIM